MRKLVLLVLLVCAIAATTVSAETIKRGRHPFISPDGSLIAFTYRGDIWTVPAEGGRATRLTIHNARDNSPIISPDGKTIVFASDRAGSADLYSMPISGGMPQRLTFNSSYEYPESFTPDGKWILFRSGMYGGMDVYRIPAAGGQPIRLTGDDWESEFSLNVAPDMKTAAINVQGSPGGWRRRGYESSDNSDIWLAEWGTPVVYKKKLTDYMGNDFGSSFSPDGKTIYFVSDRGDTPNVWKMDTDGGSQKQVTHLQGDGVHGLRVSANGAKMVFEYNSEIWIGDPNSGECHAVPIEAPSDLRDNILREQAFTTASEYETSPDGKKVALVIRGDVYLISAENGGAAKQLTKTPWKDNQITWASDSYSIYFVSDRTGNRDLWKVDLLGNETQLTSTPEDESCPVLSPDGKWLAYYFSDQCIMKMPTEGSAPVKVVDGPFPYASIADGPNFSWAPNNQWLAYLATDENYQNNAWIINTDTGEKHKMTNVVRGIGRPVWSPAADRLTFECGMYDNNDIYVLDFKPQKSDFPEDELDKLIADAATKAAEEKAKKDGTAPPTPPEPPKEPEKPKDATAPAPDKPAVDVKEPKVEFDQDGLQDRLRRIVAWDSWESNPIFSKDGKTVFFVSSRDGQIWRIGQDGKGESQVTSAGPGKGGLMLSADGNRIWFIAGGQPGWVDVNNRTSKTLSFNATMDIDLIGENRQIFNEAWWVMSRAFYDPNHHGKDWNAIREKYSALIDWVPQKDDFYELMTEMIMELDASHLGISGPTDYRAPSADDTAYLGVEPDWPTLDATGMFKIARVLPKSPAADKFTKLEVGEYIVAIGGTELAPGALYDQIMDHKAGKKVVLKVNKEPKLDGAREVAIKPINREGQGELFYQSWVESRRKLTEDASGGRIGYLHIRGMDGPALAKFKLELTTKVGNKEAMIVDVRYNGGGRIAHTLLQILESKPFCYMVSRNFAPISEDQLLGYQWNKPSALLTNQYSASNSEMFSEGYHQLGIGPVIGIPTPGAVICTGGWGLVDGGNLRLPSQGVYTVNGEDLEGKGRHVDHAVPYDPRTFNRDDADPTIAKAVEVLMKQLGPEKKTVPPMQTWDGTQK